MTLDIEEDLLNNFLAKKLSFQNRPTTFFSHSKKLFKRKLPDLHPADSLIKTEYDDILQEIDENMNKCEEIDNFEPVCYITS